MENFSKKWEKVLKEIPEFKDTADAASTEELKKIIVQSESNIYEIEKAKEVDEKLNAAKALVKDYSQSYNDSAKVQTCKVKYALFLLEGKGVDMTAIEK
jgi:hypothetical protein